MITPRIIVDLITAEPFRPFKLHMASGRTFEVRHPEMINVGKSSLTVHGSADPADEQTERWQKVSLMLIESVEPFDRASAGIPS
jgi:hypothetical protein